MRPAAFLSPLLLEDIDGGTMRLTKPLVYRSAALQRTFLVPTGFVTDFCSIPRLLWTLYPKQGAWNRAAVVHDCAYRGQLRSAQGPTAIPRWLADRLFLEAMLATKVRRGTAYLFFVMVRLFGWRAFRCAR